MSGGMMRDIDLDETYDLRKVECGGLLTLAINIFRCYFSQFLAALSSRALSLFSTELLFYFVSIVIWYRISISLCNRRLCNDWEAAARIGGREQLLVVGAEACAVQPGAATADAADEQRLAAGAAPEPAEPARAARPGALGRAAVPQAGRLRGAGNPARSGAPLHVCIRLHQYPLRYMMLPGYKNNTFIYIKYPVIVIVLRLLFENIWTWMTCAFADA